MIELVLIAIYIAVLLVWLFKLSVTLGIKKSFFVVLCRFLWTSPILLGLYPQDEMNSINLKNEKTKINILIDNSVSALPYKKNISDFVSHLKSKLGSDCGNDCELKIHYFSDYSNLIDKKFTPFKDSFFGFFDKIKLDSWVLVSDGGRMDSELKLLSLEEILQSRNKNGLLINLSSAETENYKIIPDNFPTVSFNNKPIKLKLKVQRNLSAKQPVKFQIHFYLNDEVISTVNSEFIGLEKEVIVSSQIKPLKKGRYYLKARLVAVGSEKSLWDNQAIIPIEVIADTVGVLHILGTPNWSGRFLRQFFKSEPKYDLVSFYILRDPGDSFSGDERDLSLIPFPVDRLFTEELKNFKLIVVHNFALYKFLDTKYISNLIKFVNDGGGLLFIGGSRALLKGDFINSPLGQILPFELNRPLGSIKPGYLLSDFNLKEWNGPYYDPNYKFTLKIASEEKRTTKEIFPLGTSIRKIFSNINTSPKFTGMHKINEVTFKKNRYKPLLYSLDEFGQSTPLAVASFPGKGRALWLFSDHFWKYQLNQDKYKSYGVYQKFFGEISEWLTKKSDRVSLRIQNFEISKLAKNKWNWSLKVSGSDALKSVVDKKLQIYICQQKNSVEYFEKISNSDILIAGNFSQNISHKDYCSVDIKYNSKLNGMIKANYLFKIPIQLSDNQFPADPFFLRDVGLKFNIPSANLENIESIDSFSWYKNVILLNNKNGLSKDYSYKNYFWVFQTFWVVLLVLFLPVEILFRKMWEYSNDSNYSNKIS